MVTYLLKYREPSSSKSIILILPGGPHSTVIKDMPRLYFIRFPHHSPHLTRLRVTNLLSFLHRGEHRSRVWHFHAQGHPVDWGQLCQTWAAAPDIGKVQKCGPCGIFGTDWGRGHPIGTSYRGHPIENILGQKLKRASNRNTGALPKFPRTSQPRAPPQGPAHSLVSQQKDAMGISPTGC